MTDIANMTNDELIKEILVLEGYSTWNKCENRRCYWNGVYQKKDKTELMLIYEDRLKFVERFKDSINATLKFWGHPLLPKL